MLMPPAFTMMTTDNRFSAVRVMMMILVIFIGLQRDLTQRLFVTWRNGHDDDL